MIDYYKILGVPETASGEEIKKAFRLKALMYHPDKNNSPEATQMFIRVNEAYAFLSDPVRRNSYRGNKDSYYKRKEEIYKNWVNREQSTVRRRAAAAAKSPYEEFESKFVEKAAGCTSKALNLLMIFIGLVLIMTSWYTVIYPDDDYEMNIVYVVIMTIFGLIFIGGAWKFNLAER